MMNTSVSADYGCPITSKCKQHCLENKFKVGTFKPLLNVLPLLVTHSAFGIQFYGGILRTFSFLSLSPLFRAAPVKAPSSWLATALARLVYWKAIKQKEKNNQKKSERLPLKGNLICRQFIHFSLSQYAVFLVTLNWIKRRFYLLYYFSATSAW